MNETIASDLDAAFSLLPRDKAQQAKEQVLQAYAAGGGFAHMLKWTEHSADGAFLRGGITDMVSSTTRFAAHSQDDSDLQDLARLAVDRRVLEGTVALYPSKERFAWFLPYTPTKADTQASRRVRGFLVTEPIFCQVLGLMQPDHGFTQSERRVLFQITAGLSLREAAAHDGVSFETKRAHAKSVGSKMDCAGQTEMVRTVLGRLVHLLSVSQSEAAHGEPAEAFVARYLSEDARIEVRRLPNGRILRVLSCGPERGTPLVMIHGMMFPITLAGAAKHLNEHNIRLIVPIRTGFLESRSPAELAVKSSFIDEAFSDLAQFMKAEWDGPVVILGQSLGGVLSIRFANRYPGLVSKLILQSVNLTKGRGKGSAGPFYGGLKRLSHRADIFKLVNWQYHKYYASRATGRTILSRLFDDSPIDMSVLDGEATGTEAYRMFADLYASSVFGMSGDFDFVMNSWEREARRLDKPITFVHGADDPLTSPAEFARFAENGDRCRQHIIPGGGHFAAASHGREVWRIISEELGPGA
ncbi:MAG: alpha/beta fold hydrolase [Flavobacteriaceae bacterium]